MAIAFRAATTVEAATTAALVQNVPAGTVDGDFLVWRYGDSNATPLPATPAGWTLGPTGTTTNSEVAIWYRVASSEPASYSTGVRTAGRAFGIMTAYSGVDTVTPFDVASPALVAGTTATTCPAITPVTAGAWIIGIAHSVIGAGLTGTFTSGNLTAVDATGSTTTGSTNVVGATGHFLWTSGAFTPTFTCSQTTTRSLGATLALRPAATAVSPASPPRRVVRPVGPRARRRTAEVLPYPLPYDAMVNADVAWGAWNPNEASGATIADDTGNSRPLTITGTPTTYHVQGPRSDMFAIAWPATLTESAVTAATVASAPTTGDYALEAWFYMSALPAAVVNLIQMEVTSTQYASLRLQTNGAVRMQLQSVSGSFRDTAVLAVGFWHHVVLKYQNGVSYMRVDKVSTATTAKAVFLTGATANVHGGTSTGAGAVTIGPTAFYNQFLSDARSDAHFDGFNPPAAPAFVATIAHRAIRGVQPRRRTRVEIPPAQIAVAPPSYVSDTRRTARRAFLLSRRDRLVEVIPPQVVVAPPSYVPERRRTARRAFLSMRHGRPAEVAPAQTVMPPERRRTARRGFLVARRDRLVEVVPPQVVVTPPTKVPDTGRHAVRGFTGRRRRGSGGVIPPQVVVAPPSYVPTVPPKHVLRGTPRRGRRVDVVPAQQAAPVAPPYVPAVPPRHALRGVPRRGRRADVPHAPNPAHRGAPRRRIRGLVRRVGHAVGVFGTSTVTPPLLPGSEEVTLYATNYGRTLTASTSGRTLTASTMPPVLIASTQSRTGTAATYTRIVKG